MNGQLIGGMQCCLKGCENESSSRKFDSNVGRYEMKCTPHEIAFDFKNLKNCLVCDEHYSSLSARGHKPAKGK